MRLYDRDRDVVPRGPFSGEARSFRGLWSLTLPDLPPGGVLGGGGSTLPDTSTGALATYPTNSAAAARPGARPPRVAKLVLDTVMKTHLKQSPGYVLSVSLGRGPCPHLKETNGIQNG